MGLTRSTGRCGSWVPGLRPSHLPVHHHQHRAHPPGIISRGSWQSTSRCWTLMPSSVGCSVPKWSVHLSLYILRAAQAILWRLQIASAPRSNPSRAGHARLANNPHHALNHRMTKSALAKPLASWPPYGAASGTSLSMTSLPSSVPGEQTFTFVHPPGFRAVQADFMQAVSTMDPNQIYSILSYAPYHPDSLLQLSDVSAHQGDLGQAADFLDRGLYSFERGFSGLFSSAMAKGEARLGFEKVENRGLFRALEKKVGNLAKRGCWRAACEFAKLLLALDPYTDPYGALLL